MGKNQTIRKKFLPIFFCMVGLPVILFALISQQRMRDSINESIAVQIENNLNHASESLNMVLDKYDTMLFELCTDDEMINILNDINEGNDTLDIRKNAIENELCHMCNREGPIKGITIITKKKQVIYYDELADSSLHTVWADEISFPKMKNEVCYRGSVEPVGQAGKQMHMFQIMRKLGGCGTTRKDVGLVVFSIDIKSLDPVLRAGDNDFISIVENGKIIADLDRSKIGKDLNAEKTDEYRYTEMLNSKSGFTILNAHALRIYNRMMWDQVAYWVIIAAGFWGILIALSYFMTRPYLEKIDQLAFAMNEVEKGNFRVRVPEFENDAIEIRKISGGFNHMVKQIDLLIDQVKNAVVDQKNAELAALEAQIDPHFLYNTLDTINWKAIEQEQYDISEMLGALGDILRYTVRNAGGETTIGEEIHWMKQYILLQNVKFKREPEVSICVPEEFYQYHIRKLLLQPFVENAIKHGFKGRDDELKLSLIIRKMGNQLHITIQDNGNGIDMEKLKNLNESRAEEYSGQGGEHLGVINVRERLKLYYGDGAELYFESQVGSYTKVHLFIPLSDCGETDGTDAGKEEVL